MLSRVLARIMGVAALRPLAVGLAVGALAVAGALLALRLEPTAGTETLVGADTAEYKATEELRARFGEDAIYVLVKQPLTFTVLTADIQRVLGLEGCLSGNAPRGVKPPGGEDGPCAELARTKPVQVVFGPGTFLNEAIGRIATEFGRQQQASADRAERAGKAARALARERGYDPARVRRLGQQAEQLVQQEFTRTLLQLAVRYGLSTQDANPSLNNPSFVSKIVFDQSSGRPAGTPKSRFAYIFPSRDGALVQVRLKPGLSDGARTEALSLIRRAAAMPQWRLPNGKGSYVVTGAPVVANDLSDEISEAILALLVVAVGVMALTLLLVFRAKRRLLPLGVALAATAITFGGLSLVGASLTMASIGVLPILIGLTVDYAIQLQSRLEEEGRDEGLPRAAARVARRGAPTIVTAAGATAAGFAALLLSPVPMVQGFGLLLVFGILAALLCALTLGVAGLSGRGPALPPAHGRRRLPALPALAAAGRGAQELLTGTRAARAVGRRAGAAGRAALATAVRRPGRVLAAGAVLAVGGWALDTQTTVESDLLRLVPGQQSVRDLASLQRTSGIGGEVDVVVAGEDLTDPAVVRWMTDYQGRVLKRFGYTEERGCGRAELCPAFSLPDLFAGGAQLTRSRVRAVLDQVPAYFSQGVITEDRRTATLAFGIRLAPLERQDEVIDAMREELDPPPGVRAELAGLPVLAAEANARVSSPWRRAAALVAGLLAVALVLLLAYRSPRRALLPLVPIVLATGWSALVLWLLRIPLNPMSVVLGSLVIAITTEFSVLLAERYRSERLRGRGPAEALAATYASTGRAVLASGATAIAGFAVLLVSDIKMLRDFGFVTVVDLAVSLAGVLLVLPAVLVLAEQGRLRVRVPRLRRRRPATA